MQNADVNMCEKFHNDRLTNDRSIGNRKSDDNKNNVRSTWRPLSGHKNTILQQTSVLELPGGWGRGVEPPSSVERPPSSGNWPLGGSLQLP